MLMMLCRFSGNQNPLQNTLSVVQNHVGLKNNVVKPWNISSALPLSFGLQPAMGIRFFKRTNPPISWGLDSTLMFIIYILSVLKVSKTFVFFLITSGEYLTRYGQGSVFTTGPWKRILKTYPCPNLFKYSFDVLKKKTKVLDIFNTNKKNIFKN